MRDVKSPHCGVRGDALADDAGFLVDENGHYKAPDMTFRHLRMFIKALIDPIIENSAAHAA